MNQKIPILERPPVIEAREQFRLPPKRKVIVAKKEEEAPMCDLLFFT